jgi:hypothetical protein
MFRVTLERAATFIVLLVLIILSIHIQLGESENMHAGS